MSDPTKGDAPILDPGPIITIEGRQYTVRRLGVRDTFAIARIIAVGAAASNRQLTNAEMGDPQRIGELLLAGFIAAEKTAFELLASLIGVTPKEFEDPTHFPMGSELAIIEALAEHQDLRAFFAQAGTLMRRLPEMQTRSHAPYTHSAATS